MRGIDIKAKIDQNNKLIETILNPNQFILNNQIQALLIENEKLQAQCKHDFEDGYCVYCYKEAPDKE